MKGASEGKSNALVCFTRARARTHTHTHTHTQACRMDPLARIEAYRLLARCRGAQDDATGACEALESAVNESKAVGYVWMEMVSLRDMLQWCRDGEEAVRARIDAVTAAFPACDKYPATEVKAVKAETGAATPEGKLD